MTPTSLFPFSPLSASLPQYWDLCTKTKHGGDMNPSTATGNLRGWDNPSPSHMLWQLMLLTSKGLRIFFLLSKVMTNDWPSKILYPKSWNLSRAQIKHLVQLFFVAVLCPSAVSLGDAISAGDAECSWFSRGVWASLPSHFLLQDCKFGRAFPQDWAVDWKYSIRVTMMQTVWGTESLSGRAWWRAVAWCKYVLALASSCFSLLGKKLLSSSYQYHQCHHSHRLASPFLSFHLKCNFEACENCSGMQEECTSK